MKSAAPLLVALFVLSALAPAGHAFHNPAPLLDERVIEGPFWIAWRVNLTSPETIVSFEIEAPESTNRKQVGYGLWVVRVDGSEKPFYFIGTGGTRTTEVHVDQDEPVWHHVEAGPIVGDSGATNGFAYTGTNKPVGEYWLVIVNTSPWATRATVRLFGSEGVDLVASDQGTRGGLLRETDFRTDAPYTHVRTGAFTFTAQTHSMRDATVSRTIEDSLFGLFAISRGEERNMSRVRPSGEEIFPRVVPSMSLTALEPGLHTFKVNRWEVAPRAALGPDAYVVLLWADVRLP